MVDCDVVVIGLGATGSAALHRLALRGQRVIGLERFTPGHDRGSSHGETRIIRLGYFEHPSYVPLLRETYRLWREIEAASRAALLTVTGIIEFGAPDSALVAGTLASSRQHALPHEVITAADLTRRFPQFRLPSDFIGVWQPDGGYLRAEPAVAAQLTLAQRAGAQVRNTTRVVALEPRGAEGVRIVTSDGAIEARAAVVSAGAWLKHLLPDLPVAIRITRQAIAWFAPRQPEQFAAGTFPVFLGETSHGIHYGFPIEGSGLKVAKHHHDDRTVDPDTCDRVVSSADEGLIRGFLAEHLPAGNGALAAAKTCLYTLTPDGDFVIDRLPGAPQIVVASPCSGHGFKFAPVIGEIVADLATEGRSRRDISRFSLGRFG